MLNLRRLRPSPALIVAGAALVLATSGAAIALPGKGSVKANDIAKRAVKSKSIAKGAVKTKNIAKGAVGSKQIKGKSIKGNRIKDNAIKAKQIADDTITSQQVAANGLDSSDIADLKVAQTGIVPATDGVDINAARAAAPPQELYSKGQLSIYAKCFRDTTADEVYADIFAATSADGAVLEGDNDLDGDPAFLNVATAEADRAIEDDISAAANGADSTEGEFMAMTPDGTKINGQHGAAAKNGNLAGGNGMYGDGNVCLFSLQATG